MTKNDLEMLLKVQLKEEQELLEVLKKKQLEIAKTNKSLRKYRAVTWWDKKQARRIE